MLQCQGKKKKQKSNFDKNPLENISLPYEEIIEGCVKLVKEANFNFSILKKNEEFMNTVQELASKFIELINFDHLLTQQEAEKIENQLGTDDEEPEEEEEGKEMDLFDKTGAFDEN